MAELNVVRKKKSPLPWILLALVALALLAYLIWKYNDSNNATVVPATADSAIRYDTANSPAP